MEILCFAACHKQIASSPVRNSNVWTLVTSKSQAHPNGNAMFCRLYEANPKLIFMEMLCVAACNSKIRSRSPGKSVEVLCLAACNRQIQSSSLCTTQELLLLLLLWPLQSACPRRSKSQAEPYGVSATSSL